MTVDTDDLMPDAAAELERQRRTIVALSARVNYWRDLAMADEFAGSRADMVAGQPELGNEKPFLAIPRGWTFEPVSVDVDADLVVIRVESEPDLRKALLLRQAWEAIWAGRRAPAFAVIAHPNFNLTVLPAETLALFGMQRVPLPHNETPETIRQSLSDVMARIEARMGAHPLLTEAQIHIESAIRLMAGYAEVQSDGR